MDVVLLGTGAADGWPNPFCDCVSCRDARVRGEIRGQTAALVDDMLLLDCGPEAPAAASRAGRSLHRVRYLLVTHAHPDHCGPQVLLWRSWIAGLDELCVIGPPAVIEACRQWVGPDDPVRLRAVSAGERLTLDGYDVRVLPARHLVFADGDAVLYDVTSTGDGGRLLWATDTGRWPDDWFDAVAEAGYHAVFLEQTFGERDDLAGGHLGLADFAEMSASLRECGAVTSGTDLVAVHLGHHNPPGVELAERLAAVGARPGRDGETITAGGSSAVGGEVAASRVFVTGGVRSGKSSYAEGLLAQYRGVHYVAAGGAWSGDDDWGRRIAAHRERRPDSWTTTETTEVAQVLRTADVPVLVDCLGTWLTARLDHHGAWSTGDTAGVRADVDELVDAWAACAVPVVAVSNEVGSGVVPATASGRLFRDELGRLNAAIAAASNRVVLMVAGQPLHVR